MSLKLQKSNVLSFLKNFHLSKEDIVAGISVSFVAIPQSLAYAALAGVPVYYGLYALSIPTIIAALLGTSKILSTGPVAPISLLTAALLQQFSLENPSSIVTYAAALAILVGLIQIILGLSKLGTIINYIARPVIVGFTTASAFVIGFSQVPQLFGLIIGKHDHFISSVLDMILHINQLSIETTIFGISALIYIILMKKYVPLFPSALIVVAGSTLLSKFLNYNGLIVGNIPQGLPSINIGALTDAPISLMLPSALIISVVGFMGSVTVIKSLAHKTQDRIDPNKELIAQGGANLSAGMIGSFPVAGSVSRTALNYSMGAKSKVASIIVGVIAIIVILGFSQILYYLPFAILAAIIIAAISDLIKINEIIELVKIRPHDGIVTIITLVSTLLFSPHLDHGILIGIIASIGMHLHQSARPHIEIFFCHDKDYIHSHRYQIHTYPTNKRVMGVAVDSSLTFTNATYVYSKIMEALRKHRKPKYILLLCNSISYIDSSAEEVLLDLHSDLDNIGIGLLFAGLHSRVINQLQATEVYDFIGGENIYPRANLALRAIYRRSI